VLGEIRPKQFEPRGADLNYNVAVEHPVLWMSVDGWAAGIWFDAFCRRLALRLEDDAGETVFAESSVDFA
jgi:hypothetical protein